MLTGKTKKIKDSQLLKGFQKEEGGGVLSMLQCNCQIPDVDFSLFSVLENRPENIAIH